MNEPHKSRLLNSINIFDYINKIVFIIESMKKNIRYSINVLRQDPDFIKSSLRSQNLQVGK